MGVGLGIEDGKIITTHSDKLLEVILPDDYISAISGSGITYSLLKGIITLYVDYRMFIFMFSSIIYTFFFSINYFYMQPVFFGICFSSVAETQLPFQVISVVFILL